MAIEVIQETTDWEYPNHTYVYDTTKSKILGYRTSKGKVRKLVSPLNFSKSKRKFKKVVDKTLLDAILYT